MFVRKKKNRSGTVSVVIADKSSGKFKELKTIGMSSDSDELASLEVKARQWIEEYSGQLSLDFDENAQALQKVKNTIARIERPQPDDELRQTGFSKDGKMAESQIVLGLLVSEDDYPMSYSIFNGSQYEGRTMILIIDDFVRRFKLTDFIVVADSGLMNTKNVELLESAGYRYILGARIRNESPKIKGRILAIDKTDGNIIECRKNDSQRLIVSYSDARAKKNAWNRNKGVERLRKAYAKGTLTKENVNKRGYNKFLEISKDITVSINEEKIVEDCLWDGLKGYITNTDLPGKEVISQYHGLWVVERAFRIGKGTLEMRPMFHFTEKRIEAHICICFVAYKVYKELERVTRELGMKMSVDKILEIAKTITTLKIRLPNGSFYTETLFTTSQQEAIKPLLDALNQDKN